jgi:hypothetical protein
MVYTVPYVFAWTSPAGSSVYPNYLQSVSAELPKWGSFPSNCIPHVTEKTFKPM